MHYHQSLDDGHSSNYEPLVKQKIMISSNSSGCSTSTELNLRPSKATLQRETNSKGFLSTMGSILFCNNQSSKSRNSRNSDPIFKKCAAVLFILLILLLLLVIYLICKFLSVFLPNPPKWWQKKTKNCPNSSLIGFIFDFVKHSKALFKRLSFCKNEHIKIIFDVFVKIQLKFENKIVYWQLFFLQIVLHLFKVNT